MTVVSGQTKRFIAASAVTRYWLVNCAGFELRGGGRGTVERVVADGDPFTPFQLVVKDGRRTRRLPTSSVLEVLPAERVLVVRGSNRARTRGAALGHVAVAVGVLLLGLVAWLVRAGKESARLVRSLPWQKYGHSVRSVTTRLWREISTTWWLLRTTSSAASSAKSSSRRARTTSST